MLRGLHPTDAISVRKVEFRGHGSVGGDHISPPRVPPCEAASSSAILPIHGHRRLPSAVSRPVRPLHASSPHIATSVVNCYHLPPSPFRMLAIACEWKYFSSASHPRWYQHTHDLALPASSTPYPALSSFPVLSCLRGKDRWCSLFFSSAIPFLQLLLSTSHPRCCWVTSFRRRGCFPLLFPPLVATTVAALSDSVVAAFPPFFASACRASSDSPRRLWYETWPSHSHAPGTTAGTLSALHEDDGDSDNSLWIRQLECQAATSHIFIHAFSFLLMLGHV